MIDAQAEVPPKGSGPIIPPGKEAWFLVVHAKRIDESPQFDLVERFLLGLAEENSSAPVFRIVYIPVVGRDVEIATQEHGFGRLVLRIQKETQPLYPVELEGILF